MTVAGTISVESGSAASDTRNDRQENAMFTFRIVEGEQTFVVVDFFITARHADGWETRERRLEGRGQRGYGGSSFLVDAQHQIVRAIVNVACNKHIIIGKHFPVENKSRRLAGANLVLGSKSV